MKGYAIHVKTMSLVVS